MTEFLPVDLPPGVLPFRPSGMLANHHAQSVLTSSPWRKRLSARKSAGYRERSVREIIDTGIGVYLLGFRNRPVAPDNGALVILLHGWEGSVDSNYLLDTALALDSAGFSTFRLNFRDHGDSHHLNEDLFHSCRLDEVLAAVRRIAAGHRGGPVFLVGFSLGGNFALRIARQAPANDVAISRVLAVSPVIRPKHVLAALADGFPIYETYFVSKWRRSLMRKQQLWPERYNLHRWFRHRTLAEQTRHLVADYTDFPDMEAYLEGYSIAGDYLAGLTVPSLIVTAKDDPIIPFSDFEGLPQVEVLAIEAWPHGGHCGFLLNWRLESWIEQRITRELCQHLTPA